MPEAARDGYNSRLVCEGLSLEYLEPVNRPDKVKRKVAANSQPSTVRQCTEFSVFEATRKDKAPKSKDFGALGGADHQVRSNRRPLECHIKQRQLWALARSRLVFHNFSSGAPYAQ
jgi:hypothetical protein